MRNAESFIRATLDSIKVYPDPTMDVLVIDDGSTDRSVEQVQHVQDPRVRVVPGPQQGIAAALNVGLQEARGEILMRCDADDLYPVERIHQQVELLAHHPEWGAVCGSYETIDPNGETVVPFDCGGEVEEISAELQQGMTRTHLGTFAIRAELARQLPFRSYFRTAEDIDFQLRLGERCQVGYAPQSFYRYRLHDASITHRRSSTERQFFDLVARDFQYQRLTQGSDALDQGCPPHPPRQADNTSSVRTANAHIRSLLMGQAWREHTAGRKQAALQLGLRSLQAQPTHLPTWKSVLALIVKPTTGLKDPSLNQFLP